MRTEPLLRFASLALVTVSGLVGTAVPLRAQTADTVPGGMKALPGNYFSRMLGSLSSGRMQFGTDCWKGKGRKIFSRVRFRRDPGRFYHTRNGMGRSWQNVKFGLFENDISTWSGRYWAPETRPGPYGSTIRVRPSIVYEGRWSLPTPRRWGVSNTYWSDIPQLPFSRPFAYYGNHSLVMDFRFYSGVLANNATWTGSDTSSYYLDGVRTDANQLSTSVGASLGTVASRTCNDSAFGHTTGASTAFTASVYGPGFATTSLRGQMRMALNSSHTAPRATVVHAIAARGPYSGVSIGAGCNRLYVDTNALVGLFFRTTSSLGSASSTLQLPFQTSWIGRTYRAQSAWLDSTTGMFSLTRAAELQMPRTPLVVADRRAVSGHLVANSRPMTIVTKDPWAQPLPLFDYK